MNSHIPTAAKAKGQHVAKSKPHAEATPLPPLNFSQTGNMCPRIAAKPAKNEAICDVEDTMPKIQYSDEGANFNANHEAIAALKMSNSMVKRAKVLLPVRKTLVAPILPEPILRISPYPAMRVTNKPKGIEPNK